MFQMKIVIYLQPDINIVAVNKLTAAQVFVKIFLIKLNWAIVSDWHGMTQS